MRKLTVLTIDNIATIYEEETGDRARIKPMDAILKWAENESKLIFYIDDHFYLKAEAMQAIKDDLNQ